MHPRQHLVSHGAAPHELLGLICWPVCYGKSLDQEPIATSRQRTIFISPWHLKRPLGAAVCPAFDTALLLLLWLSLGVTNGTGGERILDSPLASLAYISVVLSLYSRKVTFWGPGCGGFSRWSL